MTDSRTKGAAFEREVASQLRAELGKVVDAPINRVLDQYREQGLADIIVPPFAIECKRYAKGSNFRQEWWEQVEHAAEKADLIPALVYRFDRQATQCVVPLYAINPDMPRTTECKATLDWFDFVMIMRENIVAR